MKHLYILALISSISYGQIPAGYYNTATGSGYTLKTQLSNIIDNHNDQGYNAIDGFMSSYDLDNYYETGSNTILDIYSENPTSNDPYTFTPGNDECGNYSQEGDCYNKEHVIPQSVFSSNTPMQSDAHQLLPTDGRVNGFRGNYPFGRVNDNNLASQSGISNPTQNGSKLGANLNSGYSAGYSGTVFEPIDEFKGDIARIYFYFITRYENQVSNWGSFAMFDGSSDQVLQTTFLSILLEWHSNDSVSQKEIDRNNNIYYNHQNNRNPFVDHPEYASMIWNPVTDTEAPTAATNLIASNPTSNSIDLSWTAGTDNIAVTSYDVYVDGTNTVSTSNTSITVTGLAANTEFCFTVFAKDAAQNTAPSSNESCETTDQGASSTNEIFISEYVEGSSNNKALEIANFTGNSINLSSYTIARDVNSNGAYGAALQLTGTLATGNVHVISRGNASAATVALADQISSGDAMSFNGDDPVGLFKNGVLIDIFGNFGGTNNFANATYRRKQTVINPTTVFDLTGEWVTSTIDDISDLGSHSTPLEINDFDENSFSFFPNPVKSNQIFFKFTSELKVEIYDITGKLIINTLLKDRTTKSLDVSTLNSGLYVVKMSNNFGVQVKKLIRQ
ncbi:endonuclease [Flavobacteriaceae bacterium]|jgi:endonuclease I|nr:endonuclease [Flavobacteriaceae bacterium]MDA7724154.1 endonuclease [Flavobacteriaceae bacterium]MDA7849068.1 endonuclease [Flavobacteriaceae bacterium]MDG1308951.1 endonuclease [Flavobacteriaceae bacterium]